MMKIIIAVCIILFLAAIYLLTSLARKEKANKEKFRQVLDKMAKLKEGQKDRKNKKSNEDKSG